MSDITHEENMKKLNELYDTVSEIDVRHKLSVSDDPKIEFVNPIIDSNTQDTLVNVSSCVKLICKLVTPGESDFSQLSLNADQMHGLFMFQECIENALDFEGWRSNIETKRSANATVKEAV